VKRQHFLSERIRYIAALCLVCITVAGGFVHPIPEAQAHPHVFVIQRLNVMFDDDVLAGIKVRWKFDDMFASMIAEDHDANRNGTFEADEVKTVKEKAFSYISKHNYFTFINIDNKSFQVKYITDFNAILENKKLIYEFLVPCHVTATDHTKKVTVACYDPTYYTAMYFPQKKPVSLTADDNFEVQTAIRKNPDTKIHFDMVHPWTLFMEFRKKQ